MADTKRSTTLYCITYRTGGTDRFTWHRSLAMSRDDAMRERAAVERMGYLAHVVNYQRSLAIGLPDTFTGQQGRIDAIQEG